MNAELLDILRGWSELDTWIVIASAVVSMSCAVPGVYLLVRRQSMLGDTLSHTALPGITLGFLAAVWLRDQGWLAPEHYETGRRVLIVGGAMLMRGDRPYASDVGGSSLIIAAADFALLAPRTGTPSPR